VSDLREEGAAAPVDRPTFPARPDATDELTALMRRRVLLLDGSMGVYIQRKGLSEAEFRGERFAAGSDRQ